MFAAFCCVVFAPLLLLLLEMAAERRDRRRFPPPGHITSDGHLHFIEKGSGSPTVILESGLTASSISWIHTQLKIAEFTRVIAYDRAGLGWSAARASALRLADLLADLNSLVDAERGPVILVGHSFGGLLASAFAHLNPHKVSGLVLIDPVSLTTYAQPSQFQHSRLARGIALSKRGALLARLGIVRASLSLVARGRRTIPFKEQAQDGRGVERPAERAGMFLSTLAARSRALCASIIGRVSAGKGSSIVNRLVSEVAKLPPETYGPIRSHWSRPSSFTLMADYLCFLPEAAKQAQTMPIPTHLPVIILSAGTAKTFELEEREAWLKSRAFGRHTQIPNTTHWLQLDRPDLVTDAVRELTVLIK